MALYCKIQKQYSSFSLSVEIDMEDGRLALLGASGSGKSMTLRCIAGLVRPDEGKIVLNGVTLFDSHQKINLSPQERNVGYLFQDYALFPNMTVQENIFAGTRRLPKAQRRQAVEHGAEAFHLTERLVHYPSQLSGGERQRCALARAMVGSPDILLIDEPFSALDAYLRWQLEQELDSIFAGFGKPIVYVSHNRDEVYRLCDRITVMDRGVSEISRDKWELFQSPGTRNAAILSGCKNITSAIVHGTKVSVPDWGFEIEMTAPKDTKYIGIRANTILPGYRRDKNQKGLVLEYEIAGETEDTFKYILLVKKKGMQGSPIRWEISKQEREIMRQHEQTLFVAEEHIMLLI